MNRIITKSMQRLLLQNISSGSNRRMYSSDSSRMKNKLIVVAGTAVFLGSSLLYAKYDDDFRNQLNDYLPFINNLLAEKKKSSAASVSEEISLKTNSHSAENFLHTSSNEIPDISQAPHHLKKPLQEIEETKFGNASYVPKNDPSISSEIKNEKQPQFKTVQKNTIDILNEEDIKKKINSSFKEIMHSDEPSITHLRDKDYESEIRAQLKRQLYVINDYFQEQIILYKTELNRRFELDLKNKLSSEKEMIAKEFEDSFRKLKQMESLLKVRDSLDKQEKAMKHLYLLGQTLTNLMEHNRSALSNETVPLKIDQEIECIEKVIKEHFPDETLIKLALNSLPKNIQQNGVYSEEDLIRRFKKVGLMANQVSLIDENYSNLFDYLKSFLYSYIRPFKELQFEFSLHPVQIKGVPYDELNGIADVDPKKWDTYDIIQRVRLSIENRNLEQALRYANQLKGEPRKIAQDWIQNTRDHLEVKQAIRLVQTKIAALNLQQTNVMNQ